MVAVGLVDGADEATGADGLNGVADFYLFDEGLGRIGVDCGDARGKTQEQQTEERPDRRVEGCCHVLLLSTLESSRGMTKFIIRLFSTLNRKRGKRVPSSARFGTEMDRANRLGQAVGVGAYGAFIL